MEGSETWILFQVQECDTSSQIGERIYRISDTQRWQNSLALNTLRRRVEFTTSTWCMIGTLDALYTSNNQRSHTLLEREAAREDTLRPYMWHGLEEAAAS